MHSSNQEQNYWLKFPVHKKNPGCCLLLYIWQQVLCFCYMSVTTVLIPILLGVIQTHAVAWFIHSNCTRTRIQMEASIPLYAESFHAAFFS